MIDSVGVCKKMIDIETVFKEHNFPRFMFKPKLIPDAVWPNRDVEGIEIAYDHTRIIQSNNEKTVNLNIELFFRVGDSGGMSYLLSTLRKNSFSFDCNKLCDYLMHPSVKILIDDRLKVGGNLLAEKRHQIEQEQQVEQEQIESELDATPKMVRTVIKDNFEGEQITLIGLVRKRSQPMLSIRKMKEYTYYDLELEDIDEPGSSIPVKNLPVGLYDNGDVIKIFGMID